MSKLYFRQLLAGRDFAKDNLAAGQMENFVYLIGDQEKRQCVVIDPAWNIQDLIEIAAQDGMSIVGALATHYHPDHVGGNIFGINIEGLKELMAKNPCPIHAHRLEKEGIIKVAGIAKDDIIAHDSGDKVLVGDICIEILHTPGHTPGSICFRVNNSLVSGDTLFLNGCGRVDLPGGSAEEMYRTIYERFSTIPNNTLVYPGHAYGGSHDNMAHIREQNRVFKFNNLKDFLRLFK